jgi:hypothetical protein
MQSLTAQIRSSNIILNATYSLAQVPLHSLDSWNEMSNFRQSRKHYLPDFDECPAPNSHFSSSMLLSVLVSLSFATNLAGSEYITRGSVVTCQNIDQMLKEGLQALDVENIIKDQCDCFVDDVSNPIFEHLKKL